MKDCRDYDTLIREADRMCESYERCAECPLFDKGCEPRREDVTEEIIDAVQAWSDANQEEEKKRMIPRTRKDLLEELIWELRLQMERNDMRTCLDLYAIASVKDEQEKAAGMQQEPETNIRAETAAEVLKKANPPKKPEEGG